MMGIVSGNKFCNLYVTEYSNKIFKCVVHIFSCVRNLLSLSLQIVFASFFLFNSMSSCFMFIINRTTICEI